MNPPLSIGVDIKQRDKPVRQLFGTIFAIAVLLLAVRNVFLHFWIMLTDPSTKTSIIQGIACIASSCYLFFFLKMLLCPDFISGIPQITTFWAPLSNLSLQLLRVILVSRMQDLPPEIYSPEMDFFQEVLIFLGVLLVYGQRDDLKNCFLCFKPWISINELVFENAEERFAPQYPTVPYTYPGYNTNSHNNNRIIV